MSATSDSALPAPFSPGSVTKPGFHETAPDFAAKLKATEDMAKRYRHALVQIISHSDCPTAKRYALAALFIVDQVKGENNAI
jgi:hypothetical protein